MRKIVRVWDITNSESYSYLAYDNDMTSNVIGEKLLMSDVKPTLSIEELADFSDSNSEDRNNHDFTGLHRILAALLYKHVPESTLAIMKEIAESGGLDAMNGLWAGQLTGAHETLGRPKNWSEWSLKAG